MKKLPLFALFALFLTGCAQSTLGALNRNAALDPVCAYVAGGYAQTGTGVYAASGDSLRFSLEGRGTPVNGAGDSFHVWGGGVYDVYKVVPGTYVLDPASAGKTNISGKPASVRLEAGKITYIGDIGISRSGPSSGTGGAQPAGAALRVYNSSGAAKKSIQRNYPGLAHDLDATFVYRPAR